MKKIFFIVTALFITFGGSVFYFFHQAENGTLSQSNQITIFEIKEGQGVKAIGENLEKEKIIKNKNHFYFYVWRNKLVSQIQAGKYELSPNMNISQITEKISKGIVKNEIIKLTIPEGFSNKKIFQRLQEVKPEFAKEFERLASCVCLGIDNCECDEMSEGFVFLKNIPKGIDMEGFLFPDTYFIEKEDTAKTLLEKFLANFSKKISVDDLKEIERQEKSLFEVITMASVIEREAKTDEDRETISGIFWKRLDDNFPLQSCATLAYILGIDKPQFSFDDTKIDSPYNTYLNAGLPPGPISNPGLASIRATIYPKKSNYYYFLSDPASGKMIYSKTLDEHNQNKAKYGL